MTTSTERNPLGSSNVIESPSTSPAGGEHEVQNLSEQAKQAISQAAGQATDAGKNLFREQIDAGAGMASKAAEAMRTTARNLQQEAPQLARLMETAAGRVDSFSKQIKGESWDSLMRSANEYTRARPGLVFGAAAVCGFLGYRIYQSASHNHSPRRGYQSASHNPSLGRSDHSLGGQVRGG